jgi:hypothetical protein
MTLENISLFTGHSIRNKSELATSYVNLNTIANKTKRIAQLKGVEMI